MISRKVFDIAIVGAGPAGLTAAIYCLRDDKDIVLIEKEIWGGQINNSPHVNNIPGFPLISGADYIEKVTDHLYSISSGSLTEEYTEVIDVIKDPEENVFNIICDNGNIFLSRAIIFATGAKHRLLNVPGEEELIGNGISFCSVCDAPFCAGHSVAVIGGGNTAAVEALELSNFAKRVYIIQNLEALTAENSLKNAIDQKSNIEIITRAKVTDFEKKDKINVWYTLGTNHEEQYLKVDNVFLAIGLAPQNSCAASLLKLNSAGYIENYADDIGVAGDCRVKDARQVATACGDGASEAIRICKYLNDLSLQNA